MILTKHFFGGVIGWPVKIIFMGGGRKKIRVLFFLPPAISGPKEEIFFFFLVFGTKKLGKNFDP